MADPDLQIRGGGGGEGGKPNPDINIRARSPFWSKNKGGAGPPGPSPGSATGFIFLPCRLSCDLFPKLPFMAIGHFLVTPGLCIKTRLNTSGLN